MANVVAMGPNPNIAIAQNFTDQFMRNELARQQQAVQQQQLSQQGDYQQGLLKNASDQFDLLKQKYNDEQAKAQAEPIAQRLQSMFDALQSTSDPGQKAALQAQVQQLVSSIDPRLKPYLAMAALEPIVTPARQAALDASKNIAGQVSQGSSSPAGMAFSSRIALGEQPNPQTMSAIDASALDARRAQGTPTPNVAQRNPAPSASAVSNQAAIGAGIMPSGGQNLQAQTELQQTGMQQAGAMERQKQQQQADSAAAVSAGSGGQDLRVTSSGARYADVSQYTGKVKNDLVNYYKSQHVPVAATPADVLALHDIDTARLGQQQMYDGILGKLPKDAGGRILGGPENKLSQFFQTDVDIAAFNSWRALAIRSLRAMSGSTGLRINKSEIELAVANDIPQITDTVAVALQKAKNVNAMLMNSEQAQLGTFTPIGAGAPGEVSRPGVSPSALPPGTVSLDDALAHIRQRGSVQ